MMSSLRPDLIRAWRIIEDQAARLESVKSREKSRDPSRVANRAFWPDEVDIVYNLIQVVYDDP